MEPSPGSPQRVFHSDSLEAWPYIKSPKPRAELETNLTDQAPRDASANFLQYELNPQRVRCMTRIHFLVENEASRYGLLTVMVSCRINKSRKPRDVLAENVLMHAH